MGILLWVTPSEGLLFGLPRGDALNCPPVRKLIYFQSIAEIHLLIVSFKKENVLSIYECTCIKPQRLLILCLKLEPFPTTLVPPS